jgi:hypothetical protein
MKHTKQTLRTYISKLESKLKMELALVSIEAKGFTIQLTQYQTYHIIHLDKSETKARITNKWEEPSIKLYTSINLLFTDIDNYMEYMIKNRFSHNLDKLLS